MLQEKIILETRLVGDIEGKFHIPSYQREIDGEKMKLQDS